MFFLHTPLKASYCFVYFPSLMINVTLLFWHRITFCVRKLHIVVVGYKFQQHRQKLGNTQNNILLFHGTRQLHMHFEA